MNINRKTVAFIGVISAAAFLILYKISGDQPELFSLALALFVIIIVASIVAVPFFYKRSLEKRGPRNLRRFVMADPEIREAMQPSPPAGEEINNDAQTEEPPKPAG